jgi:predicted RNA-binding Zn-ribbon protein involved in translation (DUF1610 family)
MRASQLIRVFDGRPEIPLNLLDLAREEAGRVARGEPPLAAPAVRATFVQRTGQARKKLLADGLLLATGVSWVVNRVWQLGIPSSVLDVAILTTGIWTWLCVRCPQCGVAIMWHITKTRHFMESPRERATAVVCPKCGYDPP